MQFDGKNSALLWHCVEQLQRGVKIPWRFKEFGARAVEEMLVLKIPVGRAHYGKKGSGMLTPTYEERMLYEVLYSKGTLEGARWVTIETRSVATEAEMKTTSNTGN